MRTAIVLALFASVLLLDGKTQMQGAVKRVKIIYLSILIPSFVILMLFSLDIPVPAFGSALIKALTAVFPMEF